MVSISSHSLPSGSSWVGRILLVKVTTRDRQVILFIKPPSGFQSTLSPFVPSYLGMILSLLLLCSVVHSTGFLTTAL